MYQYRRIIVQSLTQSTKKQWGWGRGGGCLSKCCMLKTSPFVFCIVSTLFILIYWDFLGGWWEWEYSTYSDILHLVGYIFRDKTSSVTIVKIVVKWLGLKFVYLEHPYVPPFLLFFTSTK